MQLFVGNYGRLIETDVFGEDEITPVLPASANITILSADDGSTVLATTAASVETGSAYYSIPSGSAVTSTSAHLVAYFDVVVSSSQRTYPVYFYVLDKGAYLILDTWRRKVSSASPADELTTDEAARDWIDSAVRFVARRYGVTTYTSVLGALSPTPTANDREFYAEVASLMARTSWWAGRGKWRDEEMSLDPGPFEREWARLDAIMEAGANNNIMAVFESFNRDSVQGDGYKWDSGQYWYRPSGTIASSDTTPV